MTEKISLASQLEAVELCAISTRDWVAAHEAAILKGKVKPAIYLTTTKSSIPRLFAAVETLRWLVEHEDKVRAAVARQE